MKKYPIDLLSIIRIRENGFPVFPHFRLCYGPQVHTNLKNVLKLSKYCPDCVVKIFYRQQWQL